MVGGILECYCYLGTIQDQVSDGKTPSERRFGVPKYGPVVPFGYHPISAQYLSRPHQFVQMSGQVYSLDMRCTRGESGKETSWSQTLSTWKRWTHLKSAQKDSMQRKC